MSSNPTAPATASYPPLPTVRAVRWLYLTVFISIIVLTGIIRSEGVAFVVALPAANGVAIVAVVLVNSLLGRRSGAGLLTAGGFPSSRYSDGVRPPV
jgi:hypothetical protein